MTFEDEQQLNDEQNNQNNNQQNTINMSTVELINNGNSCLTAVNSAVLSNGPNVLRDGPNGGISDGRSFDSPLIEHRTEEYDGTSRFGGTGQQYDQDPSTTEDNVFINRNQELQQQQQQQQQQSFMNEVIINPHSTSHVINLKDDNLISNETIVQQQQVPSSSTTITTNERYFIGLRNLGNTCYINSCLQALYLTNRLRKHLAQKPEKGPLHNLLSKLFYQMDKVAGKYGGTSNAINMALKPDEFINEFRAMKPQFVKHEQHDAQEFLTILLERIHEEANRAKHVPGQKLSIFQPKNTEEAWNYHTSNIDNSALTKMFVGQIESSLKCLTCHHVSLSWICFWQLPLHLSEQPSSSNNNNPSQQLQEQPSQNKHNRSHHQSESSSSQEPEQQSILLMSVDQCIKEYTATEILNDDCAPKCERCQERRTSSKQQTFCRMPHYLIVHLKRFTHTGTKITRPVDIDQSLNICQKNYRLYCCVCHRGTESMGHYFTLFCHTSSTSNGFTVDWFVFDDEYIYKETNLERIDYYLQHYSYICFYRALSKSSTTITTATTAIIQHQQSQPSSTKKEAEEQTTMIKNINDDNEDNRQDKKTSTDPI